MDDLPLDVKNIIASLISDDATKRKLRLVNTEWFKIIDYRNFTLYLTKNADWKRIVNRFAKYTKPISLSLKKNILKDGDDMMEQFTRLTSLTSFQVENIYRESDVDWHALLSMTNLKHLCAFSPPPYILKELKQLETLVLSGWPFEQVLDAVTSLSNLNKLEIECPSYVDNPFAVITDAHSKLTYLHLSFNDCGAWTDEDLQRLRRLKYFKFYGRDEIPKEDAFLLSLNHMTDLEELDTSFPIVPLTLAPNLRALNNGPEYIEAEKKVFHNLCKLTRFGPIAAEIDTSYLTALTDLEMLSIQGWVEDIALDVKFSILGSLMSTKLVQLDISHVYSIEYGYFTQLTSIQDLTFFDVCDHHISVLTNLTSLRVMNRMNMEPEVFSKCLGVLTKLKRFEHAGPVRAPLDLSLLPNLESLTVYSEDIIGLETLTSLTKLNILFNEQLRGLTPSFTNLVNLRELECNMKPEYMHYVAKLTNLENLRVDQFFAEEDLLYLTALKHLTSLKKSRSSKDTVTGVHLTNLTTLQQLNWSMDEALATKVQRKLRNLVHFDSMRMATASMPMAAPMAVE